MIDSIGGKPMQRNVSLRLYSTLRAGGTAELFVEADTVSELADISSAAQREGLRATTIGWGSNILPSDHGVPGLVVLNNARRVVAAKTGEVVADSGIGFQELFLKTAQAGLHGLEYAVGIPGTLGGALVSNAGAYRSSVSEFITRIEVVHEGERKWVDPTFMQFSYRDSLLRQPSSPPITLLRVEMKLPTGTSPKAIYDEAREYQRQRISKQPPPASAGSFFKNVLSRELADSLDTLTVGMKKAGVVPAGYLIEASGLKGFRMGGAMMGSRHANFVLNVGNASAFEIRRLTLFVKKVVREKFGVELEEEVMYLGDWSAFDSAGDSGPQ